VAGAEELNMLDADETSNDTTDIQTPTADPAPADEESGPAAENSGRTAEDGTADSAGAAPPAKKATARKSTAKKTAAKKATARKSTAKKAAAEPERPDDAPAEPTGDSAPVSPPVSAPEPTAGEEPPAPRKATRTRKTTSRTRKAAPAVEQPAVEQPAVEQPAAEEPAAEEPPAEATAAQPAEAPAQDTVEEAADEATAASAAPMVLFQPPETTTPRTRRRKARPTPEEEPADEDRSAVEAGEQAAPAEAREGQESEPQPPEEAEEEADKAAEESAEEEEAGGRRRRRRGGRRRRKAGADSEQGEAEEASEESAAGEPEEAGEDAAGGSRRRRRRRRTGDDAEASTDEPDSTVTKVRKARSPEDEITGVSGSTRLEAKKQRRREGREAGRRRAPIVSEAEFLARRESVERVMVIRQRDDLTQIGVLEDKVLVEHYVARETQTSLIGNVYLGRVQNVLPSMEAAFVDIGKGRNAVLYAGEVNWTALGHPDGQPRKIESVLSPGQAVLVQVTKDPVGHKGARLTGQVSLPGRFLVYVPDGTTSGISRKLPDTERTRLKTLLKQIVPDTAGVIVRTAAEGASEDELTRDVERLTARWSDIEKKVAAGRAPELLYGEPDLTLKVVRDLFTEDFSKLVVQGDDAWDLVDGYVSHVAPDLRDRLERFEPGDDGADLFAAYRVDEQIAKGLDRKVWLPSGGSLIIDRTEAMTVIDVNTGKFTGSGGNLEETVTKNNLEAAEEIVRQLRLRDIGGIVVIDFIDMVLESNRDLVLRRLVECLGRDRTRHQVAEVTSLGLVQMTRKRIGTGLLEAFSEECPHCKGRGLLIHEHPVEPARADDDHRGRRGRGGKGRSRSGGNGNGNGSAEGNGRPAPVARPTPMDLAASRPHPEPVPGESEPEETEAADAQPVDAQPVDAQPVDAQPVETQAVDARPVESQPEPAGTEPDEAPASAPLVVTTTRRRTVRRPAGAPTPREHESTTDQPMSDEPVADDLVSEPVTDPDSEPVLEDDPDGPPVLHVPVKRKGSRKR
jgi:ribonuclease E